MRNMTRVLALAACIVLMPAHYAAAQAGEPDALEQFEGLVIGMTEAELLAAFPDGALSFAGRTFDIYPRLGDFTRGDEKIENGLIAAELKPEIADDREICLAFHDELLPALVERFGEPDSVTRALESDWAVIESNWVMKDNGIIGVLARFVDAHGKCDAKIGFRGSNVR
jgi:hypothetical protein